MTCNKRTIFIIIIEKWLPKTTAYVHDQIYFYCNSIKNAFVDSYQMTSRKKGIYKRKINRLLRLQNNVSARFPIRTQNRFFDQ